MRSPVSLVINSAPRTKKNHGEVVFKSVPTKKLPTGFCGACKRASLPIVLPSEQYRDYERSAVPQLREAWGWIEPRRGTCGRCGGSGLYGKGKKQETCIGCGGVGQRALPISDDVVVCAAFYRDAATGDLLGYQDALADILQVAGILENDRLIVHWPRPPDGRLPLRKSAERPRTELTIEILEAAQLDILGQAVAR